MVNQPIVSIIVPVYKVEKYLRQCVESVLAQTYSNWQLILVDDGSPDSSGKICDQYSRNDERIRVLHIENKGLSGARNAALPFVEGEFLTFLDADDALHPKFIELTLSHFSEDIDVVASSHTFDESYRAVPASFPVYEFSGKEFTCEILYQSIKGCTNSACGKLYRSSLFNSIRFKPGIGYEDLELFYRLFSRLNKIIYIPLPLYFYRQHTGSYIHTFSKSRADVLDVTDEMKRYFSPAEATADKELYRAACDRRLSAYFNILGLMAKNRVKDKALELRCRDGIKCERWQSLIDPQVRFRNKAATILSYLGGFPLYKFIARFYY